MQATVIIVGAAHGLEQLTYSVPPELEGRLQAGHRVLVPLRSRKMTAIVAEVGENLSRGELKPILQLMEPQPLFDRAHLKLLEFLATYYMVALGDAYRSVIPAVARVESRMTFRLAGEPDPLARAGFTSAERKLVEAVSKRPMTARQLEKLGATGEIRRAIAHLSGSGIIERYDATRGQHRETAALIARIKAGSIPDKIRGSRQRGLLSQLEHAGATGLSIEQLEADSKGAKALSKALERRGLVELIAAEPPIALASRNGESRGFELTDEQRIAYEAVAPAVQKPRAETFLVWGVTASGKTEIYLNLAELAVAAGRNVLLVVPEIALADELVRSFRARFGDLVGIAHSAQNVSERWASWSAALSGKKRIMIGPRSVIFAPMHQLGLVVVDEEHDPAYKNEEGIRYHARDLAVVLGGYCGCPVVLGSATPSAESFANARSGKYRLLRLTRRVNDRPFAEVEIVDLRREIAETRKREAAARSNGASKDAETKPGPVPLSSALKDALARNLAAGGQSMVFLNRRGFHNFLQCHACGNVIACPNCSVSMTFHLGDHSLRCHYCGNRADAPDLCPACGGHDLKGQGFGTERLTHALSEILPEARIERMDSDTSGRKGARAHILAELRAGRVDILVGTQMITKGFDFPGVTLAAVVLADLGLNIPDFRSAERTFQLLTQVAGRAGRGERPGKVIIQTYAPGHYSIRAARDQDYARFIRRELQLRRELGYPPFARLAMVRVEGEQPRLVSALAAAAAKVLARSASPEKMQVLGPAPAPIERIKRRYRWQVMVKSRELNTMRGALGAMRAELGPVAHRDGVYLLIDIDPVRML
ncbi:MAG TPA: primosomal protein N' [Candidatus Binataceae bacterium]